MQKLFFLACILFNLNGFAQTVPKAEDKIERYSLLRIGGGYQRSGFFEFGYTRLTTYPTGVLGSTGAFYTAAEFIFGNYEPVYGLKAGFESSGNMGGLGLELKYQTNFQQGNLVFTPKVGLSLLGFANLFYGYNLTDNATRLEAISPHQISLIFNLSSDFFKKGALL